MRVIKPSRIREYARTNPEIARPLLTWLRIAEEAQWRSLQDVRLVYRSADGVIVKSGKPVTVFNIGGNKFRLIVAIHYDRGRVFVLRLLTHKEYDKNKWAEQL